VVRHIKINVRFNNLIQKFAMPVVLLIAVIIIQLVNPQINLLTLENIKSILLQASVLGFVSLGLSFVMIAGETDISFAGTLGLMSSFFTIVTNKGLGYFPALLLLIITGMGIGVIVAVLVVKAGFSGLIISIAFMFMGLGIERSFNEGVTIWLENLPVQALGRAEFAGFYAFSWLLIVLYAIAFIVISRTKFGFNLRIIGENKLAALEAGVSIDTLKILAFVIAGGLFAVAATTEPIRFGGSIVGAGEGYLLPALAACYLGTTMFTPGSVNIFGTFVGSLFMIMIANAMQLLSLAYYFTPLVQGLVLIAAVSLSVFKSRHVIKQVKV
jgi:ribose transport system permease protein